MWHSNETLQPKYKYTTYVWTKIKIDSLILLSVKFQGQFFPKSASYHLNIPQFQIAGVLSSFPAQLSTFPAPAEAVVPLLLWGNTSSHYLQI